MLRPSATTIAPRYGHTPHARVALAFPRARSSSARSMEPRIASPAKPHATSFPAPCHCRASRRTTTSRCLIACCSSSLRFTFVRHAHRNRSHRCPLLGSRPRPRSNLEPRWILALLFLASSRSPLWTAAPWPHLPPGSLLPHACPDPTPTCCSSTPKPQCPTPRHPCRFPSQGHSSHGAPMWLVCCVCKRACASPHSRVGPSPWHYPSQFPRRIPIVMCHHVAFPALLLPWPSSGQGSRHFPTPSPLLPAVSCEHRAPSPAVVVA